MEFQDVYRYEGPPLIQLHRRVQYRHWSRNDARVCLRAEVDPAAPIAPTDREADEVVWFQVAELDGLIRAGVIQDAISLAALALFRLN